MTVAEDYRLLRRLRSGASMRTLVRADHGSRSAYVAGCRCDPCTDADRDYHRRRNEAQRQRRAARAEQLAKLNAGRVLSRNDCPTCLEFKAKDWANRMPIGWCGPDCYGRKRREALRG